MNTTNKHPGTEMSQDHLPTFGTAAILAGGKSSRMGFDKQLLMEDDRRLLESVIDTLKQEFSDILIITAKPQLYEGLNVRLASDVYQDKGPLAGVHAALSHARSQYVYLLACDMPVVNLPFIRHMKQRLSDTGAKLCCCKQQERSEPFNAFYSRELLPDVVHRLETGNSSLFRFLYANQAHVISHQEAACFDKELAMFLNINTRTEYEKYLGTTQTEGDAALVDKLEILRYIGGEFVPLRDLMVHERTLKLEIPGLGTRILYCSPDEIRELVVGHLYAQGLIQALADIQALELTEETATIQLSPTEKTASKPLTDNCIFDPAIILANQQTFFEESTLQKATAGTHRCALCDDTGTYFACVDISRHNAMDKLAGKALLEGVCLRDKYILTSGRIPMDMIQKVAAIGVPMVVSRSTPTIAAVEAARKANITLLGFSRENRFNIYSAPQRLKNCTLEIL